MKKNSLINNCVCFLAGIVLPQAVPAVAHADVFGRGAPVYSSPRVPEAPVIPDRVFTLDTLDAKSLDDLMARVSREGGGHVKLPAGVFWLESPVTLRSNVALTGAGAGRTVFKRHDSFPVAGSFGGKATGLLQAHNKALQNVLLKGFSIDGNWTGGELAKLMPNVLGILISSDVAKGGKARDYNRAVAIEDVEIKNCGLGMHVKGTTHLAIRNCHMRDN
ncbi:MAG: hypothetical protein LBK99_01335, partial [Opitutaceae bacterium]|nr:hypothetical protein [Opitutaceae bacterium]